MEIPSTRPYFSDGDIQAILEEIRSILNSGRLILGPYTQKLEESFREYCGVKHAVGVSSCTAALEIALRYFGVQDREVIIPTNTFVATGNAVIFSGGTPILADIKPDTLCVDPDEVLNKINTKTRGVIIVHVAGLPCPDTDNLRQICQEKGLFLLEDVAHAHGAMINQRKTGSLGDAGCFSFYPTKVMTTGTGGMLTTNDDKLADFAVSMRHHGVGSGLHNIINLGNDWLMDEISAVIGIYQLKALENNIQKRNEVAQRYSELLSNLEGVQLFKVPANIRHVYYKYPIRLLPTFDKPHFVEKMQNECKISLGSIYDPPCHLQPLYQQLFGFHHGSFPKAESVLEQTCCLPMYPHMTMDEIQHVIQSLKSELPLCQLVREN